MKSAIPLRSHRRRSKSSGLGRGFLLRAFLLVRLSRTMALSSIGVRRRRTSSSDMVRCGHGRRHCPYLAATISTVCDSSTGGREKPRSVCRARDRSDLDQWTVALERTYFRVVKSETIVPVTESASRPRTPSARASRALLLFNHQHSLQQSVLSCTQAWLA